MPIAEEKQEGMVGFRRVRDKMGPVAEVETERLSISEFNTRCRFADEGQVLRLMASMEENGFIPRCAVWVNAVTEDGTHEGKVLQYRLVAGRHRHEAARRTGMEKIPCQLFYNLEPEGECELDRLDNELDESHKPVHFLEEAEHLRFLQEKKGWSVRKIAKHSGIDRNGVFRKLKLAEIPEETKKIIRLSPRGDTFFEKYFREICKLSNPHITTICEEIAERGALAEQGAKDRLGHLIHPMKQSEIKQRVQELLKLEQEGKILKREKMPLPVQGELFMMDKDEPEEERYEVRTSFAEIEDEESAAPEAAPPAAPIPELPPDLVHRSPEKNSRGMNFDRCVRWLKLSGLVKELGQTLYMILKKIVEYDLWYQANRDEPFYFSEGAYGDPFSLIAEQGGVEREHLQKRALPALKNLGFLDYWTDKGQILFKLNWDALFGVYRKRAYGIPFKEDGLRNAPADGSFVLRPTPFHHLRIEKGKVVPWDGGLAPGPPANGDSKEILKTALRELSPPMDEKEIPFCLTRRGDAEAALKLLYEMSLEKRSRIRNEAAYVLEMIRRGPKTPQGFQSPQEVRNKEEEKAKFERFLRAFEKSKFRHFRPDNGAKREISASNDQGFFARDEDGRETFQFFEDWMDLKFFS